MPHGTSCSKASDKVYRSLEWFTSSNDHEAPQTGARAAPLVLRLCRELIPPRDRLRHPRAHTHARIIRTGPVWKGDPRLERQIRFDLGGDSPVMTFVGVWPNLARHAVSHRPH